jgi:hypothetical protein
MNQNETTKPPQVGQSELTDELEPAACNCMSWCRDFRETLGGKYPPSNHAPGCAEYKQELFLRISLDGSSIIIEENEKNLYGVDGTTYEPIMLTRDQFELIPEFQGF